MKRAATPLIPSSNMNRSEDEFIMGYGSGVTEQFDVLMDELYCEQVHLSQRKYVRDREQTALSSTMMSDPLPFRCCERHDTPRCHHLSTG
ncbi:Hypothetical protein AT6N2_L0125 [Agrobacterium tumefaciens]|nr:Hypothetical protein AT6N2_L0125 [Agrobacterium tumefaciens]